MLAYGNYSTALFNVCRQDTPLRRQLVRYHNLSVEPNSPAQRAGLIEGDVIVGFGDQVVGGIDALHRLLTHEQVGQRSPLTIIRRNDKLTINIVPEEMKG